MVLTTPVSPRAAFAAAVVELTLEDVGLVVVVATVTGVEVIVLVVVAALLEPPQAEMATSAPKTSNGVSSRRRRMTVDLVALGNTQLRSSAMATTPLLARCGAEFDRHYPTQHLRDL